MCGGVTECISWPRPRAGARWTRAQSPRPRARGGSAGGGKAAVTYFLRLRSGQLWRLDRRFGLLPVQSPAGGPGARDLAEELGPCPEPRTPEVPWPPPRPWRAPLVPQLVPVRPMNWCVLGFHTNSFHSSTTCPQLFFSFWMTILAARGESRRGAGGCGEAGEPRADTATHWGARAAKAAGARGTPRGGSRCGSRGARPRAAGHWQRGGARILGPQPRGGL